MNKELDLVIPVIDPEVELTNDEKNIRYHNNIRVAPEHVYALDLKNLAEAFTGKFIGEYKSADLSVVEVENPKRWVIQTLYTPNQLTTLEVNSLTGTILTSGQDITHVAKFFKNRIQDIPGIEKMGMCNPLTGDNKFDENRFSDHLKVERFIDNLQRKLIEKTCDPVYPEDFLDDPQLGRNQFIKRFVDTAFLHRHAMDGAHINLGSNEKEIIPALRYSHVSEVKIGAKKMSDRFLPHPHGFPACEPDQPIALTNNLELTMKLMLDPLTNKHQGYYQLSFRKPSNPSKV